MTQGAQYRFSRRLGVFWFFGEGRERSRFIGISRPWTEITSIEGRRSLSLTHEQGWTYAQTLYPQLKAVGFDHFPRGRLEWQTDTEQWRLYVDQKLLRGAFVTTVLLNWRPPKEQLVVLADSQYRSNASIGLPALPEGL